MGNYAEAARVYERSDLPDLAEGNWLNTLGFVYLELENYPRALSFLRRALRVNPLLSVIHYNLARIDYSLKHYVRYAFHRGICGAQRLGNGAHAHDPSPIIAGQINFCAVRSVA